MIRFEDRLSRAVASVLGLALLTSTTACDGGGKDTGVPDRQLEKMCEGEPGPDDFQLSIGFVEVAPGGECPAPEDAAVQSFGCTFLEFQDVTCGLDQKKENQVFIDDGYGGHYTDAGSTPTGYTAGPVVDVCYYEAVFYLPPDHPTCGRPLLHGGEAVVAGVRQAPEWSRGAHPVTVELTEDDRRALAAYWLDCARLEHASVASFAKFSLDLMALGAPPELLRWSHKAGADEVDHAERCFALAGAYAGEPLAPGPLTVPDFGPVDRARVAEALFREGCIGETLAAIDAASRLAGARDPAVRETLQIIVRDESDHAALAWRALGWLLAGDDGTLRARLDAVLVEERARWERELAGDQVPSELGRAHGLLPTDRRRRDLMRAFDEVILPSWSALG